MEQIFKEFCLEDFFKLKHFIEIGFYGEEFKETLSSLGKSIELTEMAYANTNSV